MAAVAELARLREQLQRAHDLCGHARLSSANERVSRWSPAEHVDHLLKVTKSILDLLASDEVVPRRISFLGRCVLALRWIPRGLGKAPQRLHGQPATVEELQRRLARVSAALAAVDPAVVDAVHIRNIPHPRFGGLTPAQALRFAAVHGEHHLKIVGDILR